MDLTLFLAKVLGLTLAILGVALLLRRDHFLAVFGALIEGGVTRAMLAIIQLIAGLALVVSHQRWSPLPAAAITLIGWIALLESTAYLLLPESMVRGMLTRVNTPGMYLFGGVFSVLLGGWLAGFGFGWW